mmetsp:Transcript_75916/g.176057  ORF Transcript_75916/g.176057 Transcript_75916/m.176057 type:complete len:456 (-) Transcript_75916:53-1420(-)
MTLCEASPSEDLDVVGCWQYGRAERPSEYRVLRTETGALRFVDQKRANVVSGILEPNGQWLQAELTTGDNEEKVGVIRLSFVKEECTIISNFKGRGQSAWGKDTIARKILRSADPQLQLGPSGIGLLPGFVESGLAGTTARVIHAFAMLNMGSDVTMEITGGRHEVFLTGVKADAFQDFARHHGRSADVLECLRVVKEKLSDVAFANGGRASEDIVALVGASDMQVPHLDLKLGQVQVIVALTATAPTLVYDPAAAQPPIQQVFDRIGVDSKHAATTHMRYLVDGGTPLALPVAELYDHMVPACEDFSAGDAVQIRDGIVHAGPKCEDKPGQVPRIVLFATYSTRPVAHYNVYFQYKIWDWASFPEVPAEVAYQRLLEVFSTTSQKGMRVQPWVYFEGERAEACKTLCTTAGLSNDTVEELVRLWRHGHPPLPPPTSAGDPASPPAPETWTCAIL